MGHTTRDGTNLSDDPPLAVVCDGLGGHADGEVASETAAAAFVSDWRKNAGSAGSRGRLRHALDAANDAVRDRVSRDRGLTEMGTTLVAAAATRNGIE